MACSRLHRTDWLLLDGVHHYDEYGLADIEDEPPEILKIHKEMIYFVQEWLKDWEGEKARRARRVP